MITVNYYSSNSRELSQALRKNLCIQRIWPANRSLENLKIGGNDSYKYYLLYLGVEDRKGKKESLHKLQKRKAPALQIKLILPKILFQYDPVSYHRHDEDKFHRLLKHKQIKLIILRRAHVKG